MSTTLKHSTETVVIDSFSQGYSTLRKFAFAETVDYTKDETNRTYTLDEVTLVHLFRKDENVRKLIRAVIFDAKRLKLRKSICDIILAASAGGIANMVRQVRTHKGLLALKAHGAHYAQFMKSVFNTVPNSTVVKHLNILRGVVMKPQTNSLLESLVEAYDEADCIVWDIYVYA
jgi:hypothetical protein